MFFDFLDFIISKLIFFCSGVGGDSFPKPLSPEDEAKYLAAFRENGDKKYIDGLIEKLKEICGGTIVLKGLAYRRGEIGVAVAKRGEETKYYFHERLPRMSHGTGDIYASVFTGALCRGSDAFAAAKLAADFTVKAIAATEPEHFYGVRFEKALPYLTARFAG